MSENEISNNSRSLEIPDMTVVGTYEDMMQAELARGLLASAGMDAQLDEHENLRGFSDTLPVDGRIELLVPNADAEDARTILAQAEREPGIRNV